MTDDTVPPFTAIDSDFVPPADVIFNYLLEQAVNGSIPVYFAGVPLNRIRRFDDKFRPENSQKGSSIVAAISRDWRAGMMRYMWVYPRGDDFIVSDDYFTLAAIEQGQPDQVPCWVLSCPTGDGLEQVQGPMDVEGVRKLLLSGQTQILKP